MLYVVPTPIGNLDDTTLRTIETLRKVGTIACEDTRRTRILLARFEIPAGAKLLSYREGVEERVGTEILARLQAGQDVALCSDGGMPGVSDPGYRLVSAAVEQGLPVTVLPGASAVHVALVASGLPTSSYVFKGYPPRKPGPLHRFLLDERDAPHTLVLFESPFRVRPTLEAALETLGDRRAAVCCELTKVHERITRGYLSDLVAVFGKPPRGEVTLVLAGNNPKFLRQASPAQSEPNP